MRVIARALDGASIDISPHGRQRLVAAFEASNRWIDARYGMPMLTDMARETVSAEVLVEPPPRPGSRILHGHACPDR